MGERRRCRLSRERWRWREEAVLPRLPLPPMEEERLSFIALRMVCASALVRGKALRSESVSEAEPDAEFEGSFSASEVECVVVVVD